MDTCCCSTAPLEIQLDPISTLYRINDSVRYNGKVYKAAQHVFVPPTVLLGLEANQSDWTILSDADTWKRHMDNRYKIQRK